MIPVNMKVKLTEYLFSFPDTAVYAVIDGASAEGLPAALGKSNLEYSGLFSGKLSSELAATAPYLIRLEQASALTDWLLNGWGKHYGIYAHLPGNLGFQAVRRHFRRFMVVKSPQNKALHFRYYDPRTLRDFLPRCNAAQQQALFGPVSQYFAEGAKPLSVNHYWPAGQGVGQKTYFYQDH
ncbi:MAG TPA: DUF4123 domain-containing protein [Gammaproteobacteria bacterium]